MIYYIGENKQKFIPGYRIGSGFEGIVYLNSKTDEAVKLFSESNMLELATAEKMTQIRTKYILLPRRLVYDKDGYFAGYTTPFIQKTVMSSKEDLVNYPLFYLSYLFSKLYKDAQIISSYKLIIDDVDNVENYIFNGNFYLIDPGYYHFVNASYERVLAENIKTINQFVISNALDCGIPNIEDILIKRGETYTLCDYFKDEGKVFESYRKLARRKRHK